MLKMDLEDFLSNIDMFNSDQFMDFGLAMRFRAMYNAPNLTYNVVRKFKVLNTEYLERDEDGKYFFEHLPGDTESDIIYDIKSSVELKVKIGGLILNPEKLKLLPCCLMYSKIAIRVYVDPDQIPCEFCIKFKNVLLSTDDRYKLRDKKIISGDTVYHNGMISMSV